MAKVTAVWGSPDSGKTTFAVKLAAAIYENYNSTVMLVCPSTISLITGLPLESIFTVTFPARISSLFPENVADVMPSWETEKRNQLPTL